jgi:hypothetical protein
MRILSVRLSRSELFLVLGALVLVVALVVLPFLNLSAVMSYPEDPGYAGWLTVYAEREAIDLSLAFDNSGYDVQVRALKEHPEPISVVLVGDGPIFTGSVRSRAVEPSTVDDLHLNDGLQLNEKLAAYECRVPVGGMCAYSINPDSSGGWSMNRAGTRASVRLPEIGGGTTYLLQKDWQPGKWRPPSVPAGGRTWVEPGKWRPPSVHAGGRTWVEPRRIHAVARLGGQGSSYAMRFETPVQGIDNENSPVWTGEVGRGKEPIRPVVTMTGQEHDAEAERALLILGVALSTATSVAAWILKSLGLVPEIGSRRRRDSENA